MKKLLFFLLFIATSFKLFGVLVSIPGLTPPSEDSILFYDFSEKQYTHLTLGSNLSITGTVLSATGGGGSVDDGDKGDIIVSGSGSLWEIDPSYIANAQHEHDFSDIVNLPSTSPHDFSTAVLPVGIAGSTISHSITAAQAHYVLSVRPSAQNYVMALLLEGVTPTPYQLAAIDGFYGWADATGFISGQKSGARLLLTVWDNVDANLINLLNADDTTTYARIVNSAGFLTEDGYVKTDTGAGSPGYIAFDTTSNAAWDTTDWSMAYYSHLDAETTDNAIIGGRNDGIASGYRYINTSTATVFRWSPGFTSGNIDYTADTTATFGLIYVGYKSTKIDVRRVKITGTIVGIDTTASYDALLSNVPFLGLAYNSEGGATSLSGQPCSLFYIGRKIADDATEATDIAEALYNLVVNCGAPEV